MDAAELVDNFQFFDDWQERYAYLIDLGKDLPALPEEQRTELSRVRGCMSQVWLVIEPGEGDRWVVLADSDSAIVRGLIAVLQVVYSDKTTAQMTAVDLDDFFSGIGLDQHLSPNRRNGFYAMVERIRTFASTH